MKERKKGQVQNQTPVQKPNDLKIKEQPQTPVEDSKEILKKESFFSFMNKELLKITIYDFFKTIIILIIIAVLLIPTGLTKMATEYSIKIFSSPNDISNLAKTLNAIKVLLYFNNRMDKLILKRIFKI